MDMDVDVDMDMEVEMEVDIGMEVEMAALGMLPPSPRVCLGSARVDGTVTVASVSVQRVRRRRHRKPCTHRSRRSTPTTIRRTQT